MMGEGKAAEDGCSNTFLTLMLLLLLGLVVVVVLCSSCVVLGRGSWESSQSLGACLHVLDNV